MSEPKNKKTANELEMKERSDNMDRKIIEKRKKEDMDDILENKLKEEKKRQQEIKEVLKKKASRKIKIIEKNMVKSQEKICQPENVKELPELVKAIYPDCKEFCVIGDGACCLNCLAAWILLDPTQGPVLGRDMNTHIAEYRPYYRNKLAFPLTITKAGGLREVFEAGDEDKFFDTLVSSPEASYMWRESHDLIALANFTNMEVEVVVYDQETKLVEEPTQQYKPDPEFPWNKDDANAPNDNHYPKMKLINYENCHFNLIVREDHPLVSPSIHPNTHVSKDTHTNDTSETVVEMKGKKEIKVTEKFLCKKCVNTFKNNHELNKHLKNNHKDDYITMLEHKLNETKKYRDVVINEKKVSDDEIHRLTEDLEKLKIENKELKTLSKANKSTVKKSPGDIYDRQDEEEFDSEQQIFQGKHKGFRRTGPQVQPIQIFDCTECEHSTSNKIKLDEHIQRHREKTFKLQKMWGVIQL